MKKPITYYLIKLDRLAAWVLLFGIAVYFITGYGMTKGLINPAFSTRLHLDFLPFIVLAAFVIHTGFAIHLALKRHDAWKLITKTLLFTFYFLFIGFIVYVDRFYKPIPLTSSVSPSPSANEISESATSITSAVSSGAPTSFPTQSPGKTPNQTPLQPVPAPPLSLPTFSATQLAQYNGQNDRPAYVAINGNVYDVSRVFNRGTHFSHFAGRDLTAEFDSFHTASFLANVPIVGILK